MSTHRKDYAPIYINVGAVRMLFPLAVAWAMGWLR